MTNIEILKVGYANFASGNVPAVLENFDSAIEWNACNGVSFIEGDGIFIGTEAIVSNIFMNIPLYYEGFNIDIIEMFAADDKVVMVGYYQGTWKPTGHVFNANATHVWTLKDGKIIRFFQAVDTAEIMG